MVVAFTRGIERKASFRHFAHEYFITLAKFVELRREFAVGNQLEEKLNFILVRRRDDGVRALGYLAWSFDAQGRILSGRKFEFPSVLNSDGPKIRCKIHALGDAGAVVLDRKSTRLNSSHIPLS